MFLFYGRNWWTVPPEIVDGKQTLDITLIHPPEETQDSKGQQAFLGWWLGECRRRSAPRPRWTGQDRKVALQLLDQHGYDKLKELAVHFWRRHSSSLTSAGYDRHMILFAAKIPLIEKELQEQAS